MHLVETMAYAGEKPWHGIGSRLAPKEPVDVWKKSAGMDWRIEASEVLIGGAGENYGVMVEQNGIYELSFETAQEKSALSEMQRKIFLSVKVIDDTTQSP